MHNSFKNLFGKYSINLTFQGAMSNARKMMRMAKSLVEWKKINELMDKKDSMQFVKFLLKVIPPLARVFMWVFDTLVILGKTKVFPHMDMKYVSYRYAVFWTIANVVSAIGAIYELYEIAVETAKLQAKKMIAAQKQTTET